MNFKHKLSSRLALMRSALLVIVCSAAIPACEVPAVNATDPAHPIVQVVVVPETLTLDPAQQVKFAAYGRTTSGDSSVVPVNWSATGGTISPNGMFAADTVAGDYTVSGTSSTLKLSASSLVHIRPRPVASVSVSPASASGTVGQTIQFAATLRDALGSVLSGRVVTWTTSDPAVATVTGSGMATGVAAGSATITATSEGKSGTAAIVVTLTQALVASVSVSPASGSVTTAQTLQLTATPRDAGGNALSGRAVTWSTSNPAVAMVSGSGVVTGVAAGSVTITATSEGKSGTAAITVTLAPAPVASVSVSPASASVIAGQTVQLTATPRDAGGNALSGRVVTWTTSNAGVATVSGSGLVTGLGAGSATITATSEGKSGTAAVTVTVPPVASVSVSPASPSVTAGQTIQLTATPKDGSGNALSGRVITWGSSNTGVATVSGSGLVTGVVAGSATITATSEGKSGTASITVTPATAGGDTVFYEGFESGSLSTWDDVYDLGVKAGQAASFTVAGPNPSVAKSGSYAMRADYPAGTYPGEVSKFLMPGYDHWRGGMWFRLAAGWTGGTKLFMLRGSRIDNEWSSFGTAGECPNGTDFFATDVSYDATRGLEFYTYYVGEAKEPDGVTCYGRNGLQASPPATYQGTRFPSVDTWHHLEFEVELNTPGSADGWEKFWLDGALIGTWNGIVFRSTTDVRLNVVTVELSAAAVSQAKTIYVDDVLVTVPQP